MAVYGTRGIDYFLQPAGMEQAFVEPMSLAVIAEVERKNRYPGRQQLGGTLLDVTGFGAAFPAVQQQGQRAEQRQQQQKKYKER